MGRIEEHIEVTGSQAAEQNLDRVADAEKRVGDQTGQVGQQAGHAGREFGSMSGLMDQAATAGQRFITGMFGLDGIVRLASKLLEQLERINELRKEMAEGSTESLETVLPLAQQRGDVSQAGLEQALQDATRLRKEALLPSLAAAGALGTAADINLPGGFNPAVDPQGFERNMAIAAAVGGALPTGTVETYSLIFEVLKSAGVSDPQEIKAELAKVLAIQVASQSSDAGTFAAGLASKGIKSFLAGGGSLEDAATILLQSREAVSNDAEAATTADILLRAARGSTATRGFLAQEARKHGFGEFETLTDTQLIQNLEMTFAEAAAQGRRAQAQLLQQGFEPGQFPLMQAAFGQVARDAAAKGRLLAGQVSAADVDQRIQDFANSQIGQSRVQAADTELSRAMVGVGVYSISELRERAKGRNERRLARPDVRGGEIAEATLSSEEALIEREAMNILRERILQLQAEDVDVSDAWAAFNRAESGGFLPSIGVNDQLLFMANAAVNNAARTAAQQGRLPNSATPVVVNQNVTNMGTVYVDEVPGRNTEPFPDHGE